MIVQLTIRDNLIYSLPSIEIFLNPLRPLSRFTFSLTAILSAPSCPCAPSHSTHCATAVMICGGSSCSRAEAHISCPRGLLSAPVTVTVAFTDPVPAWACPALCGSFHFWKLYVMCALCFLFLYFLLLFLFCNWWHPIAGAELDWLWNVDHCERERKRGRAREGGKRRLAPGERCLY